MRGSVTSLKDALKRQSLAASDRQFEITVYGSICLVAAASVLLELLGISSIVAYIPLILVLMAVGGFMAQGYAWRQQHGMSKECRERQE